MGSEPKYQAGIYIIVVSCDTRERIIIIIVSGPAYDLKNRPEILGEACRRPNRDNGPESLRDRRNGKRPVRSETRKWSRVVDRSDRPHFCVHPATRIDRSLNAKQKPVAPRVFIVVAKSRCDYNGQGSACLPACLRGARSCIRNDFACTITKRNCYSILSSAFLADLTITISIRKHLPHPTRLCNDNLCKICARDFRSRYFNTYIREKERKVRSGFFARGRKTIWKRQYG